MIGGKRTGFILTETIISLLLVTTMMMPMGKQVFNEFQQVQKIREAKRQAKTEYFQAERLWQKTQSKSVD